MNTTTKSTKARKSTKATKSTEEQKTDSPSTKEYIYGKFLKETTSDYGKNIQVVVVKNKNYTGKVKEFNGADFAYIKERLYKGKKLETGHYYRFLVLQTGVYMNTPFIKRMEITELPKKLQEKYEKLSLEKWKAQQEKEEKELDNQEVSGFSDDEE